MTTNTQTVPKKYRAFVREMDDETSTDEGFWIYLNRGFADLLFDPFHPSHVIHEDTKREAIRRLSDVTKCTCPQCK